MTDGTLVRLAGPIDERFPLDVFADVTGVLVADLGGVTRITSFGIRSWMQAIAATTRPTHIYFANIPPWVMAQFGMVAGLGGARGQILSFQAPYRCNKCGADHMRPVDRRSEDERAVLDPPPLPCADCGAQMEFDDLPDLYREALAGTARLEVVPGLFSVLGAGDENKRPLRVAKSVEEEATVIWLNGPLDERANLRHAWAGLEGNVVLVGEGITLANRAGVDALDRLVARARMAGCRIWLAYPSDPMLEALSAVDGALAPATIVHRGQEANAPPWLPSVLERRPGLTPSSTRVRALFAERYQLLHQLGAGGMAEIFVARQLGPAGFDRRVAIKRILPHLARERAFLDMFLAEARLAARLSHPNIVQIHELIEGDGQYYIVMEYVQGRDLASLLAGTRRSGKAIPVEIALRVVASVCAGLEAAHTARDDAGMPLGIVHRDVSPQNILLGADGSVKLADFGVARAAGRLDLTRPGVIKGKLPYLPPEVLAGQQEPDARTDIFAAGIVLFECLAGYHPFRRGSDYQTYQAILAQPIPPISAVRGDVPERVERILARALAREPHHRYATAREMLIDLEEVIAELRRPVAAPMIAAWMAAIPPENAEDDRAGEVTTASRTLPDKKL